MLAVIAVANSALLSASALPGFAIGLALGVVAALAYLSFYTALRIGPISVVSPVVAAYGGLTVVLAVLFRGESLAPLQGLGAVPKPGIGLVEHTRVLRRRARLLDFAHRLAHAFDDRRGVVGGHAAPARRREHDADEVSSGLLRGHGVRNLHTAADLHKRHAGTPPRT